MRFLAAAHRYTSSGQSIVRLSALYRSLFDPFFFLHRCISGTADRIRQSLCRLCASGDHPFFRKNRNIDIFFRPVNTFSATDVAHFTYNHIENYIVVCNFVGPAVAYESTIDVYR